MIKTFPALLLCFLAISCIRESNIVQSSMSYPTIISTTKFASGFNRPTGLAIDSAGDLLVVNLITGVVDRLNRQGVIDTFAIGINGAADIAINSLQQVYVSYYSDGTVKRVSPNGGTMSTFVSNQLNPSGLCFDKSGNLYIADFGDNTVRIVSPSGTDSVFARGFSGPVGLTIDKMGNLYVANRTSNSISRVTSSGNISTYAYGIPTPHSLAFDINGNLYVSEATGTISEFDGNTIDVITPSGFIYQLGNSFYQPSGLAFDASGALYVSNLDSGFVSKVTLAH